MTRINDYKKTILMTLLIAPLFTAGIAVWGIQNSYADFESPPNSPPTAFAQDVTKSADDQCLADVTEQEVDNGSFDPDGDPIILSLLPTAPFSLGSTTVTLTVTDASGASNSDTATVNVVDDIPPTLTCDLVPVNTDDDDENLFRVEFSASDNCDANPFVTALLNGEPVINGQLVELEIDDDSETQFEDGILEIEAPIITLTVRVTDASGNVSECEVSPTFVDDDNDNGSDDDNDD